MKSPGTTESSLMKCNGKCFTSNFKAKPMGICCPNQHDSSELYNHFPHQYSFKVDCYHPYFPQLPPPPQEDLCPIMVDPN